VLSTLFAWPAALIAGILGIWRDERKGLAVRVTVIAAIGTLLFVILPLVSIVCR